MKVNLAHLQDQGIDFAVFEADAASKTEIARNQVLSQLISAARAAGLKVDKGALAFTENGRLNFFGPPDLVRYLIGRGPLPQWTHAIKVP